MGDYYEQQFEKQEEREVNFRDYLQIIYKRKGIILSVFILVFLITVIRTYTATPYYTAYSRVLIERNNDARGLDLGLFYGYEPDFLNTQSEIIKSLNVARRVVTSLDLAKKHHNYFFPPADAQPSLVSSVRGTIAGWVSGLTSFLVSESKQEIYPSAAVEKVNQTDLNLAKEKIIAGIVSGGLSVQPMTDTKIVSINYTGRDPAMVALITNAVVTAYMDEMLEIKIAS